MKQISLYDHRLKGMTDEIEYFNVECSCGKTFETIAEFNYHQKEGLNEQLKEQNIELEIV